MAELLEPDKSGSKTKKAEPRERLQDTVCRRTGDRAKGGEARLAVGKATSNERVSNVEEATYGRDRGRHLEENGGGSTKRDSLSDGDRWATALLLKLAAHRLAVTEGAVSGRRRMPEAGPPRWLSRPLGRRDCHVGPREPE